MAGEREKLIIDLREVQREHWNDCTGDIALEAADLLEADAAELAKLRHQVDAAERLGQEWYSLGRDGDDEVAELYADLGDELLSIFIPARQILGRHACPDWDGLVIEPHHHEWDACTCDKTVALASSRNDKGEVG